MCSDMCVPYIYYTSYNDSKNETYPIYEFNSDSYDFVMNEEIFKTIEEKVPITTFTYEKSSSYL